MPVAQMSTVISGHYSACRRTAPAPPVWGRVARLVEVSGKTAFPSSLSIAEEETQHHIPGAFAHGADLMQHG